MPDAAWYPDPADPARARWWDGSGWTAHTREVTTPSAPPSAPPFAPQSAPHFDPAPAYVPMERTIEADAPPVTRSVVGAPIRAGGPFTIAIVLFALLPLVEAFGPTLLPNADQLLVRGGFALVVIAASVGLAFWDRHALDLHGYTRSTLPQPAFAVIPVLYLVIRMFRLGAVSVLFVLIWIGIQAGSYAYEADTALGLAGGDLPIGVAPTNTTGHALDPPYSAADRAFVLTVAGMEAKVAHDSKTSSPVECQPLPSTSVGSTTTCDVQLSAGAGVRETIEVQDADSPEPWIVASTAPLG